MLQSSNLMRLFNEFLIRIFQWLYYVFFVFCVLTYFGVVLILPLAALVFIVNALNYIGLPGLLSLSCALPAVIYLGMLLRQSPELLKILSDTGIGLVKLGSSQNQRFEKIVKTVQKNEVQELNGR